ncbi:MAG TPA: hypothetical protein VFJ82_22035 [Longimicrobium sp.]|nr:hypothetical protein [Longimicrobium sp.]
MGKSKHPHSAFDRGDRKAPRSHFGDPGQKQARGDAPNVLRNRPPWAFRIVDLGGPWCWSALSGGDLAQVLQRLKQLESMTWGEIEGGEHHFVDVAGCSKQARDRLQELKHDDTPALFSLRVTGRRRIYGMRNEHVLGFLWWDPEHEVYPSRKKHT